MESAVHSDFHLLNATNEMHLQMGGRGGHHRQLSYGAAKARDAHRSDAQNHLTASPRNTKCLIIKFRLLLSVTPTVFFPLPFLLL
jgi:hypothetical protein